MNQPFLKLENLAKRYGPVTAVDNVSLDIAEGEFMTFLGPSGSGKSTTLYMVAGLEQPSGGKLLLNGTDLVNVPPNKRSIGMVFQRYTLFPHLSVGENIAFPLKVRRLPHAKVTTTVAEMLRLVRLQGYEDRKPAELSGGQQQRVALARALAYNPSLLLMDEPLSALDKKLREEIQFEIKRVHSETGVTVIYVTHDQEEALRLSDRIAVFSKGVIDQVATGFDLHEAPATRFVAEFIGDSNFIDCEVLKVHGARATISLAPDVVIPDLRLHKNGAAGHSSVLMLRPERISLSSTRVEERVSIPASVIDTTFLGNNFQITAEIFGKPLTIRVPIERNHADTRPGSQLFITFSAASARVFA